VLRDFHSRQSDLARAANRFKRVGVIDFQDAMLGLRHTIWCRCCRTPASTSPSSSKLAMLTRYIKARRAAEPGSNPASFAELYAIMSAQRNTRLLGTFARLNLRDGKPQYLRHQPRIWTYLHRSLAHPALAAVRQWVRRQRPPLV